MKPHLLQKVMSFCAGLGQPKAGRREWRVYQSGDLQRQPPPVQELRCEERLDFTQPCAYEMIEGLDERAVVIHYGEACSLNISSGGMLLMMDQAPRVRQLLEIHTPISKRRRALMLFEVRWTRPIWNGNDIDGYLVGCKLTFGPCPYFLFQRDRAQESA
ncbi:MAG TPA: hypothetical protein VNK46_14875 [Nitrospiraceae bacterium]|jgi:hypothetical protein|nr:hypothetical protein [Nitrospiraceae bacterium]